jgi:O-antigen/teichoic acid export membrane protein
LLGLSYAMRMVVGDVTGYLAYINGRTKYILSWSIIYSVAKLTIGTYLMIHWGILGAAYYSLFVLTFLSLINALIINYQELKEFTFFKVTIIPLIPCAFLILMQFFLKNILVETTISLLLKVFFFFIFYIVGIVTLDKEIRYLLLTRLLSHKNI